MTRMTGPDCVVMCNLINTHTHTHTAVQQYIQYTILCSHVAPISVLQAESVDTTFAVQQGEERGS